VQNEPSIMANSVIDVTYTHTTHALKKLFFKIDRHIRLTHVPHGVEKGVNSTIARVVSEIRYTHTLHTHT